MRSFKESWYLKFPWLEYSVEKDAAYCLYCYLFGKIERKSESLPVQDLVIGRRLWKFSMNMLVE